MLNEGYTTFDPVGVATPTAPNLENEIKIADSVRVERQRYDSLQAESICWDEPEADCKRLPIVNWVARGNKKRIGCYYYL